MQWREPFGSLFHFEGLILKYRLAPLIFPLGCALYPADIEVG